MFTDATICVHRFSSVLIGVKYQQGGITPRSGYFPIPNSSFQIQAYGLLFPINEEVVFIDEDEAVAGDALGDGGGYGVAFVFDFGRVFDADLGC